MTDYILRPFASMDDYRACVELQEETWGDGFSERVSPAILKVSQILGGVAAGAFDADGRLDGFVFGMTGPRKGVVVHWSDMLAVRRHLRDSGLGRRLKAYQRQVLLERGVEVNAGSMGCVPVQENSETPSTYYGNLHAIDATCSTNFHADFFVHVGRRTSRASASSSGAWPAPSSRRSDARRRRGARSSTPGAP